MELVACMRARRGVYMIFMGKAKRKSPVGRPGNRWEDNIKIYLQEVGWGLDWISLAQNWDRCRAVVNAVTNFRIPYNAENFLTS
jgi:hypothetical protein